MPLGPSIDPGVGVVAARSPWPAHLPAALASTARSEGLRLSRLSIPLLLRMGPKPPSPFPRKPAALHLRGRQAEEKFFNVLISLHLGFEDLFVFNCRNKQIVRTSVLLAFAAQIRAAASPAAPRADERENRRAFELRVADGSQVAVCVCWGGGIYSLVRFICSPCFPFFSLSQRFSWMLFPRRLCSSDKAPPAPRSSCLRVTPEHPATGYPLHRGKPAPPAASPGSVAVALPAAGQGGGQDVEGLTN